MWNDFSCGDDMTMIMGPANGHLNDDLVTMVLLHVLTTWCVIMRPRGPRRRIASNHPSTRWIDAMERKDLRNQVFLTLSTRLHGETN